MSLRINNEEGFTLLETLIALLILGISVSILLEGYFIVTNTIEYQRNYNYVLNWSEGKISEIANNLELGRHGFFNYSGNEFHWSIEEEMWDTKGIRKIKLNVNWQGSNGSKNYVINRILLDQN